MLISQYFYAFGAGLLGLLGSIHLYYTFFSSKFDSYDPAVDEAMKTTTPRISKDTTMWKAWIGFNASHSVGPMFLASVYLPLSITHFSLLQSSVWFAALPLVTSLYYLLLAKKYWFSVPFNGIGLASLCFLVALVTR
ncbi:MAG: LIC_13387 family protein [Calditrichia bacterium]